MSGNERPERIFAGPGALLRALRVKALPDTRRPIRSRRRKAPRAVCGGREADIDANKICDPDLVVAIFKVLGQFVRSIVCVDVATDLIPRVPVGTVAEGSTVW
jgi:hypothetical protein